MIHDWQSGWILKNKASDLSKCWRKKIRNPNPPYFLSRVPPWRHETPNGPMVFKISARETLWFFKPTWSQWNHLVARFSPYHIVRKNHPVEFSEKVSIESMNLWISPSQKHLFLGSKKDYFCQAYLDTVWMRSYFWFRRKKSTSNLSVSPYQSTVTEPKSWTASACPSSVSITSWWVGWLSSDPNSTAAWNGRNSPPVKSPNPATRLTQ